MKIPDTDRVPQLLLARVLGVTAKTIRNWGETGCPRRDDGRYCLKDVLAWRIEVAEARAESGNGGDSPAIERWRLARAKLSELELAERERTVLPVASVNGSVGRTIVVLKNRILGLPTKLAATLAALDRPEDVFEELTVECREVLTDARDDLLAIIGAGVSGETTEGGGDDDTP